MEHGDIRIGDTFTCGERRWRCTDKGTRVIVAICLEPHRVTRVDPTGASTQRSTNDPSWHLGPPYAVPEHVFDESDLPACTVLVRASE